MLWNKNQTKTLGEYAAAKNSVSASKQKSAFRSATRHALIGQLHLFHPLYTPPCVPGWVGHSHNTQRPSPIQLSLVSPAPSRPPCVIHWYRRDNYNPFYRAPAAIKPLSKLIFRPSTTLEIFFGLYDIVSFLET